MRQPTDRIGLATGLALYHQVQAAKPAKLAPMVTLRLVPTVITEAAIAGQRPFELIGPAGSVVTTSLSLPGYTLVPGQTLVFPAVAGETKPIYYTPNVQSARVHFQDAAGHELVPAITEHGYTAARLSRRKLNGVVAALEARGRKVMQDPTRSTQLTDCPDCQEYAIIFA